MQVDHRRAEEEVMKVVVRHAVEDHRDRDTPELRNSIKDYLEKAN